MGRTDPQLFPRRSRQSFNGWVTRMNKIKKYLPSHFSIVENNSIPRGTYLFSSQVIYQGTITILYKITSHFWYIAIQVQEGGYCKSHQRNKMEAQGSAKTKLDGPVIRHHSKSPIHTY